jgi:glycosyltransferase involved in cell wall biosynthesis
MRIGVAIPCYKYHIPVLKRCLDSIEEQSVKPDQVVVSCSSCQDSDIPAYNYSFPLRIITHTERKNAAQNRNIAASHLDTDIISFFDCDDQMHPRRLEGIKEAFCLINPCDIVLHSYMLNEENVEPFEKIERGFSMQPNCLKRSPTGCAVYMHNWSERLHHSQVSVSQFIFGRYKFKEDPSNERREDALFCGDVLDMPNCQNVYIFNKLSKYYAEGQTHEV